MERKTKNCELSVSNEVTESDAMETDGIKCSKISIPISFVKKNYKMNHLSRGKAIIFNHLSFKNSYSVRKGTASDVKNLTKALSKLGFKPDDINIHENLSAADISHELNKVQQEDHSERDLLMIFVLTHGNQNDKISAYDVEYPVESLWEPFTANKCKTLAGKPKIFFVVACRGDSIDHGERLPWKDDESVTEVDAKPFKFSHSYSIPVWSDFLYVYSTYKGYLSYRNIEDGTWYIQAFWKELSETDISQISFTDFLTAVNGRLARLFETGNIWETRKQTPIFSSTLTKCLYFTTDKNS